MYYTAQYKEFIIYNMIYRYTYVSHVVSFTSAILLFEFHFHISGNGSFWLFCLGNSRFLSANFKEDMIGGTKMGIGSFKLQTCRAGLSLFFGPFLGPQTPKSPKERWKNAAGGAVCRVLLQAADASKTRRGQHCDDKFMPAWWMSTLVIPGRLIKKGGTQCLTIDTDFKGF